MTNRVNLELSDKFVEDTIRASEPSIDLSTNSPDYDILVKHHRNTLLPSLLQKEREIDDNRSLLNTDMPEADYDGLLANIECIREEGDYTSIESTYVFSDKIPLNISSQESFIISGVEFAVANNTVILEKDYVPLNSNEYFFKLTLRSRNIGSNTVVGTEIDITSPFSSLPEYKRGFTSTILNLGKDRETNALAFESAKKQFVHRNLINRKSITGTFTEKFGSSVIDIFTAGYQEKEMVRDKFMVEIPKPIVRIFFLRTIDLILPEATIINYNKDSTLIYRTVEAIDILDTDEMWKTMYNGMKYIEVEIESDIPYTPNGFQMNVQAGIPSLDTNPDFLGASTKLSKDTDAYLRVGGKTDIFVKTQVIRERVRLTVPTNTNSFVEFPSQYKPILKVHDVFKVVDNNILESSMIFDLSTDDPSTRFTATDTAKLFVDPTLIGQEIIVDITYSPYIQQIHNFSNDFDEVVINADTKIKYPAPIFVGVLAIISGFAGDDVDVKQQIADYINQTKIGVSKSQIISIIQNSLGIARNLDTNTIQILAQQNMPDCNIIDLDNDDIVLPVEDTQQGISINNTTFLCEAVEFKYL